MTSLCSSLLLSTASSRVLYPITLWSHSITTLQYPHSPLTTFRSFWRRHAASPAGSPAASSSLTSPKWNRRFWRLGLANIVGAGALWWDGEYNARTLSRNFRTIWHGAAIALDYKCGISLLYFFSPMGE